MGLRIPMSLHIHIELYNENLLDRFVDTNDLVDTIASFVSACTVFVTGVNFWTSADGFVCAVGCEIGKLFWSVSVVSDLETERSSSSDSLKLPLTPVASLADEAFSSNFNESFILIFVQVI